MHKNALCDEILLSVDQPVRYIGGELNMIVKDPSTVDIRFCMCFPDVYEIGMSHLGIQILYEMLNRRDDVYCERVYSPWPDLHKIMKEENIPLFALESQQPILDFDFLGITLQYEMCYTNILQILDLAQIPFFATDRDDSHPIVIGGGPCTYNPEPIADFFDIFYIGEGEIRYNDLLDLYKEHRKKGFNRSVFLHEVSLIPGMYVPSLYDDTYNDDGTFKELVPKFDDVPTTVKKQVVMDLDTAPYPTKPLVPFIKVTQDRVVLEVLRGCIRGCRFCQAGYVYRPTRERSLDTLIKYADSMLKSTGHEEITLSSLSTSDYSELEGICTYLLENYKDKGVNISLPSLRIDAFSLDVMSKVQDIRKSSLTFAPEAGTQRMRNVINKGLSVENIMDGSKEAFLGGWNKVKLYFMLGLPTETEEDIKGIAHLGNEVAKLYYETVPKENRQGKCMITLSTSFFVPKPLTPLQWAPMYDAGDYLAKAKIVNDEVKSMLNHKSMKYNWHEADVSVLEGLLARGDRKLSRLILKVYEKGGFFDAWTEFFDNNRWLEAIDELGIDVSFYNNRTRSLDEAFPWDFIDDGVTKEHLMREWEKAMNATVSPNCRMQCMGCGVKSFGGGVCYE